MNSPACSPPLQLPCRISRLAARTRLGVALGALLLAQIGFAAPPVITSPATASGNVGVPFTYQITATNTPTRYDYDLHVPSLGIAFFTGIISGTPSSQGTYSGTISATNADGTGSAPLTITIGPPIAASPVITSPPYALAVIGRPFSYQIAATNSPTSFDSGFFGEALSLNATTGVLSGTATGTTRWVFSSIFATNAAGTGIGDLMIAFAPETPTAPEVFYPTELTFIAGEPLAFWIGATNSPAIYDATPMPGGLGIAYNLGLIDGTPATPGTYTVNLSAINAAGMGNGSLTLTILAADSYEAWLYTLSWSGPGTVPEADPDRDGQCNFLEFAFRTDPLNAASASSPTVAFTGNSLALTHRRNKSAGVTWTYEVTSDFVTWASATPTLSVVDPDADGDGKTELIRALLPLSAGDTRKFLRLSVTAP